MESITKCTENLYNLVAMVTYMRINEMFNVMEWKIEMLCYLFNILLQFISIQHDLV